MAASVATRYCPRCGLATADALCARDGTATIERTSIDLNAMQFRPGDVLASRYRIVKLLGRGGYGAVFAAEHTGTGQPVALKLLASDPNQLGDENQRRFFREAAITARLRHPNTVRVHDFGQAENGALFMALELIEGPTLAQKQHEFSKRGKAMPELQAIDMAIAVLRSLGEAHTADLVHRDLKPANIMYAAVPGEDPVVKVLDFGIVRARDSSLTASGTALGTPEYMSPEQCSGEPMDGRSDLYSLGVILFECVTGRLPFLDENPLRVMMMQLSSPPPDVRMFARTPLTDGFVDIVNNVLAKNPLVRFADARQMRAALETVRPAAVENAKIVVAHHDFGQTAPAKRPQSEVMTPSTAGRSTVLPRAPGPTTLAHAVAQTQAHKTTEQGQLRKWFAKRELRIAALGAGGALLLLAIFAGGYLLAMRKTVQPATEPPDSPAEVAENAIEPVAVPKGARFVQAKDDTVVDSTAKLTWQRDVPSETQTWAQAAHACRTLSLGGRGWRLPKKEELRALADTFDADAFPAIPAAPNDWFWSDTPYTGSATTYWGVAFEKPSQGPYDVTAQGHVRCVK
jgi:serine/threonine protein kinase